MPTLIETGYASDWLKREADSLYSRDQVTIAAGANLVTGTVVGKVTANGKFVAHTLGASDGSQTVAGILLFDVAAAAADTKGLIIARDAIVSNQGLTYGSDVTTPTNRATVNAALKALGILVREGA